MAFFNSEQQALIKKEYAHLETLYFNSAYFGPSPYSAKQKVSNALAKELDPSFIGYNTWMGIPKRIREHLARILSCDCTHLCLQTSSSDVMNLVANGIKLKANECIVSINGEYPSNVLPFMRAQETRGLPFKLLDIPEINAQTLAHHLPPETRALALSHITFDTGRGIDLSAIGELCRQRGILFFLDTTQSLGGLALKPEHLQLIDVMTCSSYKWMLGPYGHAFAYFSPRAQELIEYTNAAWTKSPTVKDSNNLLDYTTKTWKGARKFDRGQSPSMLVHACLEAGLELIQSIGLDHIEKHNRSIRDYFLEHYPQKKYQLVTPLEHAGNIICLQAKSIESKEIEQELKYNNIDVSVRQGKLRLSFHLFNTIEQVEALIRALDL